MRKRMIAPALAAFLCITVLAGCTGSTPDAIENDWEAPAELLWSSDDALISETAVADGVALAFVTSGEDGEAIVARDATTGEEIWRQQSIPGSGAPGIDHTVELLGDGTTAFLAASDLSPDHIWGELSVVDIATGESRSPNLESKLIWSDRPSACLDTMCVSGSLAGQESSSLLMFRSEGGGTLEEASGPGIPYLEEGRFLGDFVSASSSTGTETLSFGENGAITWSRPYENVFGVGTSSNGGWAWIEDDDSLPLVGVGYAYSSVDYSAAIDIERDMSASRIVGLDRATGGTQWALDGVESCPATGYELIQVDSILVGCRTNSGTAIVHWDGTTSTGIDFVDVDIDLVGIDMTSGDVVWEVPLGDDPANFAGREQGGRIFFTDGSPIVTIDGSAVLVDPKTGSTEKVPDHAVLLCSLQAGTVNIRGAYDEGEPSLYRAATPTSACSTAGELLDDATLSIGTLRAAGFDTSIASVVYLDSTPTAFAAKK